ncbi:transposable element Tcb2 transposase [Trichonephila clavipes]|nr:transposable element Tcb2 transposase [Trichonephila clavipes]
MLEVGWSSKKIARQLGRSDCVTSRQEDHHIVRNARVQKTVSLATIQAQVAPPLGIPVSSRTIRRRLAEGHLGSWCPLLGFTWQNYHKTISALFLPFLYLPSPQIGLQSSISGIIWDGKFGIPQV